MYRSGSCSAKTFLFVWSRMTLMLTKQPRSSFLERNIDMMAVVWVSKEGVGGDEVMFPSSIEKLKTRHVTTVTCMADQPRVSASSAFFGCGPNLHPLQGINGYWKQWNPWNPNR